MRSRPALIAFDGSPSAEHAIHEAAALLTVRTAVIVTVWEAGAAYATMEGPSYPATPFDLAAAAQADQAMLESVRHTADRGGALATRAGFEGVQSLVVPDEGTVAGTVARLAREHDARVIVVGSHGRNRIAEVLLGGTSRALVESADRPVLVVRPPD